MQELLRSIHQELPLDSRCTGAEREQHTPVHRHKFAAPQRVQQVFKKLQQLQVSVPVFVEPVGVDLNNVSELIRAVTAWLVERAVLQNDICWSRQCPKKWAGFVLTEEEAKHIVSVAVGKTAMKLKFLSMYIKIRDMERNVDEGLTERCL